jgi:hypothetical protein
MLPSLSLTVSGSLRSSRVLVVAGFVSLAGTLPLLVLAALDQRLVGGQIAWIKPAKFCASSGVYFLTLAWLLSYLPGPQRAVLAISRWTAAAALLEVPILALQAARGVPSHFNTSTWFDGALFGAMGVGAFVQMGLLAWALRLFCTQIVELPRLHLAGIRAGIALLLVGIGPALLMIARGQHAVGVADGGPGLPVLHWSTQGGDLRIVHFLGLHALQILPLVGWLLSRLAGRLGQRSSRAAFMLLVTGYALAMLGAFLQALFGLPLVERV